MVQKSQQIVILTGSSLNAAIAAVLPLLLNTAIDFLTPIELSTHPRIPKKALLILNEDQLSHLAQFRLQGFAGPVLTITSNLHRSPTQKHRILRWGQQSHATFTAPYNLSELLEQIADLVPLEPENLKMLQQELTAPQRWFKSLILPALRELTTNPTDTSKIASIVAEIRPKTPVACHASIEIAGETAQIQQHFTRILQELASSASSSAQTMALLRQLRETFDQWSTIAISGGEGLGSFS
jgi:hypothetical protein